MPEPDGTDEEDELALVDLDGDVVEGRPVRAVVQRGDVLESDHGGFSAGLGDRDTAWRPTNKRVLGDAPAAGPRIRAAGVSRSPAGGRLGC